MPGRDDPVRSLTGAVCCLIAHGHQGAWDYDFELFEQVMAWLSKE